MGTAVAAEIAAEIQGYYGFNFIRRSSTTAFSIRGDTGDAYHEGHITASKDIILTGTNAKISGSSTSTGSFGVLQLSKYNQGIGDVGSTVFGVDAAKPGMSGTENTAIGSNALTDITSGAGNTALGREAAMNVSTGGDNVAIGKLSLSQATTPVNNVAVGNEALRMTTTGGSNVGVGRESGYSGTTHSGSVYLGEQAGYSVTTGNQNIAIGHNAINGGTTTGDNNIAIGAHAGDALTSGYNNVLVGKEAGPGLTTGTRNVGVGAYALRDGTSNTELNVAVGSYAGYNITTGIGNVMIGYSTATSAVGDDYSIVIGYGVDAAGGSNTATIGNASLTDVYMSQDSGATVHCAAVVEGSSLEIKTNISEIESPLEKISKLRGIEFDYKETDEHSIGMVAEEVNEVFPELVSKDKDGKVSAMSYSRMTAVLLEAIKELNQEVKELKMKTRSN
jgi:hypothetical protein